VLNQSIVDRCFSTIIPDTVDVASSVLVAPVISSLNSHDVQLPTEILLSLLLSIRGVLN
jgi:hypothetical protein